MNVFQPFTVGLLCFISFAGASTIKTSSLKSLRPNETRTQNGMKALSDIVHRIKMNRHGDGVHLTTSELEELLQRIRSSGYLNELRELQQQWRGKHSTLAKWHVDPDVKYNMSGLVRSKGYPIEEYEVTTADGYILGLFRIPHGKHNANKTDVRSVVYLQHGLLACSTNWVENLANESLGFILADAGYDVWMGNMRGNTYSRKHVHLNPDKMKFWQFSWDQMAKYDIPALLTFALAKSKQSQLAYVGHSQGSLVAFAGFTLNPELAKRVKTIFALGPIYTVGHVEIILKDIISSGLVTLLADVLTLAGIDEFLPKTFWTNVLAARTLCAWPETRFLCENLLMFLAGYSEHHMNHSRIQVYLSNEPAGTSLRNMEHFVQMVMSNECQMYDYGWIRNMIIYNSTTPPRYHVEDLTVPVALFWAENDRLADPEDVKALIPKLQHLIFNKKIENFEHLDFIWAMDAKSIVYDDILRILRAKIQD